jgi:hypothetical protein
VLGLTATRAGVTGAGLEGEWASDLAIDGADRCARCRPAGPAGEHGAAGTSCLIGSVAAGSADSSPSGCAASAPAALRLAPDVLPSPRGLGIRLSITPART